MEENVALDSSKQKKFVKSIKGIKKLIKKNDADSKTKDDSSDKVKTGRVNKRNRKERGLVYLSHIPHGFYENEMTQYFKQFGVVTNARVIKSKRTGRSKGFAFVEFKEPAVAQIVSETMNNYLMGKRLIKAAYIPPEKQKRRAFRKHWNSVNNPGSNFRLKIKKAHNEDRDEAGELKRARKMLSNINKTKKKLAELGIDYSFFTPVDVPEALSKNIKTEKEGKETITTSVDKKKGKKADTGIVDKASIKNSKKAANVEVKQEKTAKTSKPQKADTPKETATDKTQKQKNKNLKDKGVTPLEDFINITQDSNDSDSSYAFDSDEYESVLKHDDDSAASGEESDDDDEGTGEDSANESGESEVIELPQPKNKRGKPSKVVPVQTKKNVKVAVEKKGPQSPEVQQNKNKRKAAQKKPAADLKKPKFEKQSNQKPLRNKQFKKKK